MEGEGKNKIILKNQNQNQNQNQKQISYLVSKIYKKIKDNICYSTHPLKIGGIFTKNYLKKF